MPINGTNMLHILEGRDQEEYERKYPDEQKGNNCDDNGRGANLAPCTCGDDVSTVWALKVGQGTLSKFGCYDSNSLRDWSNLHRHRHIRTHTHTHTRQVKGTNVTFSSPSKQCDTDFIQSQFHMKSLR